ncbi:MAG: hypothetical protein J3R72DRAFT_176048 [Linnemannia gamsii]|nr:MAG: hypothetical protein J3R72DRAFT_176048 [Linnemannia gamsii]
MNSSTTTTTILFTPSSSSSSSSSLYSSLSSAYSYSQQQPSSPPSTKTLFHNPISIPQQYQLYEHNAGFYTTPSTPPTNTISSSSKPNRHSLPKSSNIWQQHQQQMQQQQEQQQQQQLHNYQHQQQLGIQSQKPHSAPSSPLFPLTSSGRGAGSLLPRLSLDTSQERLQQKPATIIQHGDQNYLKLFSPTLVESPVSYLDEKQQVADKKMWEHGPDEAFQRQLDMERREAYKGKNNNLVHKRFLFLTPPAILLFFFFFVPELGTASPATMMRGFKLVFMRWWLRL